jgi:hypothetical protein
MAKRIFPAEVKIDSYVIPVGFPNAGQTRFVVTIEDAKHSKELLVTPDWFEAARFARRSAGQRGLPVVDNTGGNGAAALPGSR